MIFFDLPTSTKVDRRNYAHFRKFLKDIGFEMIQFSVYVRITRNHDDLDKYQRLINAKIPLRGDVRCLAITEKQYSNIKILIGNHTPIPEYGIDELVEI